MENATIPSLLRGFLAVKNQVRQIDNAHKDGGCAINVFRTFKGGTREGFAALRKNFNSTGRRSIIAIPVKIASAHNAAIPK
ncbi:hypothetical protein G7066_08790 [Leucobacter coleopterorum]|uniref:Transposase n=1 Tax=Leucobacter coleopterorum TaxID=2714933 RepID=A0ABX6JYJ6_9MICO|nr:hypothetical protein [Leucobacter coleopterorum]QIM18683.1 hypothetical protein G7066_08790 [Leucobacter coleopterorum]